MKSLRMLLADDHGIVRAGLRSLFAAEPSVEVVAEAEDGVEAVSLALQTRPDVAIVDIEQPGLDGIEVTRRICGEVPRTRVLILSMHDEAAYAHAALAAGASGYLVKRAVGTELLAAVRAVSEGRSYLNVSMDRDTTEETRVQQNDGNGRGSRARALLSPRELEVLQLLAQGHTNKEIGAKLQLSIKTVGTYRARVGEKLGLNSRAEIVRFALAEGLLSKEES